ncbi:MAG: TonB-dependent receptor, partial [Gammaproteobacteria bacterium]
GRDEALVSQLFGTRWDTGKASVAYQYSDATPLAAAARGYAANADKRPFGGGDYRSFYSNPGNILDPATLQPAYGIPGGQNGASLAAAALSPTVNLENQFARYQLFPERRAHSLYASASQAVGERFELFADGQFTQRNTLRGQYPQEQMLLVPRTNPFFVAPQAGSPYVIVAYSFLRDLGPTVIAAETRNYMGTVGAKLKLADNWHATLSESYGRERLLAQYGVADQAALSAALADSNPATAFNPFADGSYTSRATLAAIQRNVLQHAASGIQTTSLVADGPLVSLPAGAAKVAVGLEHRQETLDHDEPDRTDPSERTVRARYARYVSSAFAELSLPLVGGSDSVRATPRLQLTLAGRFEDYSDFGHTFNPQARLRWIPLRSLKLRASWGTSFRAPTLDNLYDSSQNVAGLAVLPDPRSASGQSLVLARQGNNPNLTQETATTWTAGLDLAPESVPGLKLSVTYYAIDYQDRIVQPAADDPFNILVHESEWAAVITRNPTQAQIAAICDSPEFFGSRADCLSSSPAAIVDTRLANLGATKVNGLDVEAHHTLDSRVGTLGFGLNGSYVFRFAQAVTRTSPSTDILNTAGNPLALRVRVGTEWSLHRADLPGPGLNLTLNHTGGYRNSASALMPRVAAWTTLDLQLRYRTPTSDAWWSGMEFVLNGVNVLDRAPPFIDSQHGYDSMNVQPLGRVISLFARKNW